MSMISDEYSYYTIDEILIDGFYKIKTRDTWNTIITVIQSDTIKTENTRTIKD